MYVYSTMAHEYFLGTRCFFPAKFAPPGRERSSLETGRAQGISWDFRGYGIWASYNLNQRPKPIDDGVREIIPFYGPTIQVSEI